MANFDIRMDMTGNVLQQMKKVSSQMRGMQKQTKRLGAAWKSVAKGIIGAQVIGRIKSGFGSVIKTFDDTQKAYQDFSNKAGVSLKDFRKSVVSISVDTGLATQGVTKLYDAIASKNGDMGFAKAIVPTLAKLQVASGASEEDLGKVASMMKNLGVSSKDASKDLAILYAVGKRGSVTATEMAQSGTAAFAKFNNYYKGAATSGDVQKFGAAMQVVFNQTGNAAEASTSLERAYENINLSPAIKIMQKYGVSTKDAAGHTRNIMDVMHDLGEQGITTDEQIKAFGRRGINVYNAAMDKAAIKNRKAMESLKDFSAVQKDADANSKDFSHSINKLAANFTGALLPALAPVASALATMSTYLSPAGILGAATALTAFIGVLKIWRLYQEELITKQTILDALTPGWGWAALGLAAVLGGMAFLKMDPKESRNAKRRAGNKKALDTAKKGGYNKLVGKKSTAPQPNSSINIQLNSTTNIDKSGNVKQSATAKRKTSGFGIGGSIFSVH